MLHVGPSITPLLYDVLLRLRMYKVVLIGDIRKAFLSIGVHKQDRDALRFFWTEGVTDGEIEKTVIYRSHKQVFRKRSSICRETK